ncbi:MAG: hypothetical protein HZB25_02575 [Candidatus Eisenbacteria bacterium]|nr:hypothetical protein [Candidatus Eisenbacteria bacterium]
MRSIRSRLAVLVIPMLLALPALSGCARNPGAPQGRARVALAVRWAAPAAADSMVDSLTAEALDAAEGVLSGPVSLELLPDRSFRGRLDVHAGGGRRIRVHAFARGDEFYRGTSDYFTLRPADSIGVSVTLAPSVEFFLEATPRSVAHGDSFEVALRYRGSAPLRGVQADLTFNPVVVDFAHVVDRDVSLAGFDWSVNAPGRLRVLLYGNAPGERLGPGGPVTLCTLRFERRASCPGGDCPPLIGTPLGLQGVSAAGVHGLSQPVSAAGDSVVFK